MVVHERISDVYNGIAANKGLVLTLPARGSFDIRARHTRLGGGVGFVLPVRARAGSTTQALAATVMKIFDCLKRFIVYGFACWVCLVGEMEAICEEIHFSEIQSEYNEILNTLSQRMEMTRLWSLVGNWALLYLEDTPNATATDLLKKLEELDSLEASVVQLVGGENATYVVSANVWERGEAYPSPLSGTFFIVTRTESGSFRVAWTIKNIADKHAPLKDAFGVWSDLCHCNGPLIGEVVKLPPNKMGDSRFYIEAIQATNAGEVPRQISLWEWDGHEATPIIIRTYRATVVTEYVKFDGEYLTITIKEDYTMLWSCDMNCPGAEVIWTLRVTPDGVDDLGYAYAEPEMKLLSNLWDRVLHDEPTDDLASPQVAETVRQIIQTYGEVVGQGGGDMVISTTHTSRLLCFGPHDELDEQVFFEINDKENTPYFSQSLVVKNYEHSCWKMTDQAIHTIWNRIKEQKEQLP